MAVDSMTLRNVSHKKNLVIAAPSCVKSSDLRNEVKPKNCENIGPVYVAILYDDGLACRSIGSVYEHVLGAFMRRFCSPFWDRAVILDARVNAELYFLLEIIEALSGLQFAI